METAIDDRVRGRIAGYLREHIPISSALGVTVKLATPDLVCLAAPLAPNLNHHAAVFGGSAAALATLAAWTLLFLRLERAGFDAELVIQRSSMEYLHPIPGDFEAVCLFDDDEAWSRFESTLRRRGRARLTLASRLICQEREMASFVGDFVALLSRA